MRGKIERMELSDTLKQLQDARTEIDMEITAATSHIRHTEPTSAVRLYSLIYYFQSLLCHTGTKIIHAAVICLA